MTYFAISDLVNRKDALKRQASGEKPESAARNPAMSKIQWWASRALLSCPPELSLVGGEVPAPVPLVLAGFPCPSSSQAFCEFFVKSTLYLIIYISQDGRLYSLSFSSDPGAYFQLVAHLWLVSIPSVSALRYSGRKPQHYGRK